MAKVKLGNLAPGAMISQNNSVFLRDTPHGPVLQKKPRPKGRASTPYDFYRQVEFGIAARMAATPFVLDFETAKFWAKGTQQVWRDVLVMLAFGTYMQFEGPDGKQWESFRKVNPNPQYILDMITTQVGSLLYRDSSGWVGLNPPAENFVLGFNPQTKSPTWVPGGGSGSSAYWIDAGSLDANFDAVGAKAVRWTISDAISIDRINAYGTWRAPDSYGCRIFEAADMTLGPLIADGGTNAVDSQYSGSMFWNLSPVASFEAGKSYWLLIFRTTATGAYDMPVYTAPGYWPILPQNASKLGGRLQSNDPATGDVLDSYSPTIGTSLRVA